MSVANMLTQIRNAQAVNKESVKVKQSNLNYSLGKALEKNGYIGAVAKKGKGTKKYIELDLKYNDGAGAITEITLVSKPGKRIYNKAKDIRPYKNGVGIKIISTPKGLMNDREARKSRLGGEVLCKVW